MVESLLRGRAMVDSSEYAVLDVVWSVGPAFLNTPSIPTITAATSTITPMTTSMPVPLIP
jgi:hypothetical protein